MHEFALTQELVKVIGAKAEGARIRRVELEIGAQVAVLPDAVQFAFRLCTQGTAAEGAQLDIIETPTITRCRVCGREGTLAQPLGSCPCGSTDLEWSGGDCLRITRMEVETDV